MFTLRTNHHNQNLLDIPFLNLKTLYGIAMKKIFLFIFLLMPIFSFCDVLSRKQYLEDIASLEEILKYYCISYDTIQKSGRFDMNKKIRELKNENMKFLFPCDFFDTLCNAFDNIPDHHITFSYLGEERLLWNKEFKRLGESSPALIENSRQLYLSLTDFRTRDSSENAKRFEKLDLSRFDIIIFDLRGNPGGEFDAAARIFSKLCGLTYNEFDRFNICEKILLHSESPYYSYLKTSLKLSKKEIKKIEKGKALVKKLSHSGDWLHIDKGNRAFIGDIFILVDGGTASSAEVFTILLRQNFKNITILGIESAGAYSYGGVLPAMLPNSGIIINVTQFQTLAGLLQKDFLDSEEGLQPDFLTESVGELQSALFKRGVSENIIEMISDSCYVNDKDMKTVLTNLTNDKELEHGDFTK